MTRSFIFCTFKDGKLRNTIKLGQQNPRNVKVEGREMGKKILFDTTPHVHFRNIERVPSYKKG